MRTDLGPRPGRRRLLGAAVVAVLVLALGTTGQATAAADPCAGLSPVACENLKPGAPSSEWDIVGSGSESIQGFATDISVNAGSPVSFKINTDAPAYRVDIYRLGWYAGNGARKVATVSPSAPLPQRQPACLSDPATNLLDCGNWAVSATWSVPASAVSGLYLALLTRSDTGAQSHIPFIVRVDSSRSEMLVQTSDTTWQAYNTWGGTSLYQGPNGRGLKVSYNRPFATRDVGNGRDYIFGSEYPMIRFLERNGYDVSYISGLDSDRLGSVLLNHKLFLSSGHDEYWSGRQRTNVEAARDRGVNLAFFSGNEVYWKTRWEPSIDGSGTANRTLVCYKETFDGAKTDPSPEWTGTWRDPRLSPPSDGGRPENALTGTAYMSNDSDLAITVSAAEGKTRLWRNTAAAGAAPGGSTTLAPHSVGYESDEDLDNGFRPAGLVRLSTTTGAVPQYLQDYGKTVAPGTTTHSLTMYRAASGAKVFSTGTIQWAWGLDPYHDSATPPAPVDLTMQQATVNVLADLGAQPTTLMPGLAAAAASTDTTAPTASITSPAAGSAIPNGTTVTATGTASDVGGVVAGIEVSTDEGATWHPATGTSSWSYTYVQRGSGTATVRVRATDDSVNTGAVSSVAITSSCPCTLFGGSTPKVPDGGDASPVEVGIRFAADRAGWVTGVRFYKAAANTGTHIGSLWTTTGQLLAQGTFVNETPSGWQQLQFASPVQVTAGTAYIASYFAPNGRYAADPQTFGVNGYTAVPLSAPRNTATEPNGVYAVGHAYPAQNYGATWYGVDAVFSDRDTYPPVLTATTPADGSSSVPVSVWPSATYSEDVVAASAQLSLATASGTPVSGSSTYDAATRRVTFSPASPLANDATFVATVRGTDLAGNAMAPATLTFRTAKPDQVPGVCPCSVWSDSTTPQNAAFPDSSNVELGMKFSPDSDGVITGVRFYKGVGNAGPHTGSLWSATGQLLATATFAAESTSGWQTVSFSSAVAVTAGVTYVVSYHAPAGRYAVDINAFSAAGVNASPLIVPRGAGAYRVGGPGFPSNASDSNYWVDPVFNLAPGVKPTVSRLSPSTGTTSVPVSTKVEATFAIRIQTGSATIAVTGPGGAAVPGTTAYSTTTQTATFTPASPLAAATAYQVTVSGARSASGTVMDPVTGTFTTSGLAACPCTLFSSTTTPGNVDSGDASPITVGVAVVPDSDGYISAIRFYKAAANTGTHTGTLWSATGQRLATGTFTSESPSGWQTLTFAQPVGVVAGQRYVASYFAPNGRYSGDGAFFATQWVNSPLRSAPGANGVFRYGADTFPTDSYNNANYWVDVVFNGGAAPDLTAPSITSRTPLGGASSVPTGTSVVAVFSEPVVPASLSFTVKDGGGAAVAGSTAYDATTRTATFSPAAALARDATYTATVSAADAAGNAMPADSWSFRTVKPDQTPGVCPCSVWNDSATPAVVTVNDPARVELGMKFTVNRNTNVSGIRFYKGPSNTGTHTGSLWSSAGQLLATTTFAGESTTGWQTATFSTPVAVTAGTVYVVSYLAPAGAYSATVGGLSSAIDAPPLRTVAGGGAYLYGGGFPANASSANYWVDPVVSDGPPVVSALAVTGSGTSMTVTWSTDQPSTSRVDYGTTTALGQTAVGASGTSHSVTVTGLTANTRYYLRVTSANSAGQSTTFPAAGSAPASYAPAPVPVVTTTKADFAAGTFAGTVASDIDGGVLTITPTVLNEFSGTTLPADQVASPVVAGGSATVSGGSVTLTGARLLGASAFAAGRSVVWKGALGADDRLGWSTDLPTQEYAVFAVDAGGNVVARTRDLVLATDTTTVITPAVTPGAHEFRVDWVSGQVAFLVDGTQVATSAFSPRDPVKTMAEDAVAGNGGMVIDWMRVAPFASGTTTYTSAVVDASAPVLWNGVAWDATVRPGTTLAVEFRSGSAATPGAGWTAWAAVPTSGSSPNQTARYAQFRLVMTSSGPLFETPTVRSVTETYQVP